MLDNSQMLNSSTEEWNQVAREASEWADRVAKLAQEMHMDLSATESAEHLRMAATLAQSATQTKGSQAKKLKHSAINAADKAARLAQLVIFDLSQVKGDGARDQILVWSKALSVADKLVALPLDTTPSSKPWWKFWE